MGLREMTRLVSRVYEMGRGDPPCGAEADRRNREFRAEAWRKLGVAVIDPEDVKNDYERLLVIRLAEERYGRRGRG